MSDLSTLFSALGDETRRAILARLREGEQPLSSLAEPFAMSQTAVTRHVRVLEDAGLVHVEKRGRTRHCRRFERRESRVLYVAGRACHDRSS